MYNLLVKDLYLIKKHLWVPIFYSFIIFILFSTQNIENQAVVYSKGVAYSIGTVMIGYTMIMYTTAYDDKNNSEVILNSLPLSRITIVLSRYLSVFIFGIIGMLSMVLAGFILNSLNILNISTEMMTKSFIGGVVGLGGITFLYLPIYFKFGYIKARMFNMVFFIIIFAGPMIIGKFLDKSEKPLWINKLIEYLASQPDYIISLFIVGIAIMMGVISIIFSINMYRKREF